MRSTGILAFGRICTQFVSFILLPLYTAVLTPADYGMFDLLNTAILLLIPIVGWQTDQGAFRLLIDCRTIGGDEDEVISTTIAVNWAQCVAYAVMLGICEVAWGVPYFAFLLSNLVLNVNTASLLQIARGRGRTFCYALGSFLSAATAIVCNVVFLVVFHLGMFGLLLALNISQIIALVYLIGALRIWKHFSFCKVSRSTFRSLLGFSLPLVPNSLCWWGISMAGRVILTVFLGAAANGVYSVAGKFSGAFTSVYNVFNLSWCETMSLHVADGDRDAFFSRLFEATYSLFVWASAFVIALIPFIYGAMVDPQYVGAYGQIPILMVGALAQVFVGLLSAIYIALKQTREIAKTSFYAAVVSVGLALVLVGPLGITGVSVATCVAFAIMSVYRYVDVRKRIRFSISFKRFGFNLLLLSISLTTYYFPGMPVHVMGVIGVGILGFAANRSSIGIAWEQVSKALKRKIAK